MLTGDESTDKIRRGKRSGKIRCLCSGLFSAESIRRIEGNKGNSSRLQETEITPSVLFYQDSFCMYIFEHSNNLDFTIEFRCNSKKQYKCLSNPNFPLRLPQKTKHHSGDPCYADFKWYSINLQCILCMHLIGGRRVG